MVRRVAVVLSASLVLCMPSANAGAVVAENVHWSFTDGSRTLSFCLDISGTHEWAYTDSAYELFYSTAADKFSFDTTKGKGKASDETAITGTASGSVDGKMQASWKAGGSGKAKVKVPGVYSGWVKAPAVIGPGSCD